MNSWQRRSLTTANIIVGLTAFLFPFFIHMHGSANNAHATDAPFWSALIAVLAVASIIADIRTGEMSSTQIALLGICSGLLAGLRLFDLPNGANAMFFLVVLFGAGFGARFGYYVGALGMVTSAFFTGGFGPWLPFQAIALAWMGAGSGLVVYFVGDKHMKVLAGALAAYAFVWGFLYGGLLNLWFWPIYATSGPLSYHAGETIISNMHHYWSYYAATSALWDTAAAFINATLVAVTAVPVLRSFRRISHRLSPAVLWQPLTPNPAVLNQGAA